MKFKTYYDEYKPVTTTISGDSMAMQEFKEECDINRILKKYDETGLLPNASTNPTMYADVSDVHNLFDVFKHLENAQASFETIPSEVRMQFGNDPLKFESWIYNNPDQARKYGYINNNDDLTTMNYTVPNLQPNNGNVNIDLNNGSTEDTQK